MSVPTYESTLEHYGLTDTQLKEKCRECVLRKLASKLDRWREMAIHLKLEKVVTDSVDGERLDEEGKRYRLLERWTQISGHKATYERLVRCLLEATRADLAEFVCEAIKEQLLVAEAGIESPDKSTIPDPLPLGDAEPVVPSTLKSFPSTASQESAAVSGGGDTRYIPSADEVDTHLRLRHLHRYDEAESSTDEEQIHNSSQEKTNGDHPTPGPSPPTSLSEIYKIFRSHFEVEDKALSEFQKAREAIMKELMASTAANKEDWVKKEREAGKAKLQLEEEQRKQQTLLGNLKLMEEKIKLLEDSVYQKEMKLKQERGEKQEKCEQLTEVETQLQHSHAELDKEKNAKDNIKIESEKAFQRIAALQKDLEKASSELELKRKERENDQRVIKWFQLVEEQLKLTLEQQRGITANYRIAVCGLVIFFIILFLIGLAQDKHH